MKLEPADFTEPQLIDLLHYHLQQMRALSPPEHSFALDLSGLQEPTIALYTVWQAGELLGCGAIKTLSATHGELKSMRTAPAHLRRGVAAFLLQGLLERAREMGLTRLSLETGSGPAYEPALKLYQRFGFTSGPAFSDYQPSEFNQFLHLDLA